MQPSSTTVAQVGSSSSSSSSLGTSGTGDSSDGAYWVETFCASRGNEIFCAVDDEYLLDRFNLTNLQGEVGGFGAAYDVITDAAEARPGVDGREALAADARHLYGLIHARYILTVRGMQKMAAKAENGDFGRCPRVLCLGSPVVPLGLHDAAHQSRVRLYCPKCQDVYVTPGRRHSQLDAAYWGTTFAHLLLQAYPSLGTTPASDTSPSDSTLDSARGDRYTPRIFGFKIHAVAQEHRQQDAVRLLTHSAKHHALQLLSAS